MTFALALLVTSLCARGVIALYGLHGHWIASSLLATVGMLGVHLGRALALGVFGAAPTTAWRRVRDAAMRVPRLISVLLIELVIVLSLAGGGYIVVLPLILLQRSNLAIALCLAPVLAALLITFVIVRLAYVLIVRTQTPAEAFVLACDLTFRRPRAATASVLLALVLALPAWLVAIGAQRLGWTSCAVVFAVAGLFVSYAQLSRFVSQDTRLATG